MIRRYVFAILLLGVAAALADMSRAAAQGQSAITIEVQAGYDGAYRLGEWFPVVVTVANDGPDVRGVLEWRFAGRPDEPTFQHAIDLPRGSRKRVTMDVFAHELVHSGQLRLLDGGTMLAEQNQTLEEVDQGRFLVGVISSDPALLNSLNLLSLPGVGSATVRHMDIATLPESAAALRGVNALFFHDVDTTALAETQRNALALWVEVGGQLVVSGGGAGQRTAAGLADLLPAEVTGGLTQGDLAPLGQLAGTEPPAGAVTLSEARPRERAAILPSGAALLYRWYRGAGAVTLTTFDLAGLRGWDGESRLWGRLLVPFDIFAPGLDARQRRLNLLQTTLRLPSLGLPSAGVLLCFMVGYIFVVGPLNYLVLRRLRRLEWAWLSVPATVLLFASGLYVVGFSLRGGQSQVNQVAVVQSSEGGSRGFVTAFIGLFSPRRTSYTLTFPPETLVSEAQSWNDLTGENAMVLQTDGAAEVPDVLVDVGSVRTFMAEGAVDVPISVQSEVRSGGGRVEGQIRNTGPQPLEDVLIVRGTTFQSLGTIAPGTSRELSVGLAGNFPWGVSLPRNGMFDRQQMLSSLFESGPARFGNPNNSGNQTIDEQGVYMFAWSSAPSVGMRLDGREAAQDGLTLYIIRLNDGVGLPLTVPPTATPAPTAVPTRISPASLTPIPAGQATATP
ncbi:MAG: hypothetical protein ACJ8CR_33245 [Roseiflexaceae bacterium]